MWRSKDYTSFDSHWLWRSHCNCILSYANTLKCMDGCTWAVEDGQLAICMGMVEFTESVCVHTCVLMLVFCFGRGAGFLFLLHFFCGRDSKLRL